MVRFVILVCLTSGLLLTPTVAIGQSQGSDVELLKRELDLLKRELELVKRENEILKRELESYKKGGSAKGADNTPDAALSVTVDDVEYVYQGSVRNGPKLTVTILATSKDGFKVAPQGQMTIIDDKGNKFNGMPVGGFGAQTKLREGIPVKLQWHFGATNAFTGAAGVAAPSAKITRFAGVIINRQIAGAGETIDFRNVPAVIAPAKAK